LPKNAVNDTISKKIPLLKKELWMMFCRQKLMISEEISEKMTYLNKNAQVKYQDMQIDADYISIDDKKHLIYAEENRIL
jgi:hypothetical protein